MTMRDTLPDSAPWLRWCSDQNAISLDTSAHLFTVSVVMQRWFPIIRKAVDSTRLLSPLLPRLSRGLHDESEVVDGLSDLPPTTGLFFAQVWVKEEAQEQWRNILDVPMPSLEEDPFHLLQPSPPRWYLPTASRLKDSDRTYCGPGVRNGVMPRQSRWTLSIFVSWDRGKRSETSSSPSATRSHRIMQRLPSPGCGIYLGQSTVSYSAASSR